MDGKLPEIYWYVFWVGLVLIMFGAAYMGGKGGHERAMKALDILKMYAEKGAEPPPAMMDQLTRQALGPNPNGPAKPQGRAAYMGAFIGFLFTACVAGGIYSWLKDNDGPSWGIVTAGAVTGFFSFGATGFLLAALISREN
jgi:hypothetical protein